MFKNKIIIVLKSGYEIRIRAKEYNVECKNDFEVSDFWVDKANYLLDFISFKDISSVLVKKWYQAW
jgi:hypothetical protein